MPVSMFCWRCQMEIPMLDELEWAQVEPLLNQAIDDVHRYKEQYGVSLAEAKEKALGATARAKYEELTGFSETNVNAIWHHRASLFGPICSQCGKPLRTPRASFCAECDSPNPSFNPDAFGAG